MPALFALMSLAAAVPKRWRAGDAGPLLAEMLFLAGAIAGPIVSLTTGEAKSPVVGGIVVVSVVLALALMPRWLGALPSEDAGRRSRLPMTAGGALCFAVGLAVSLDPAAPRIDGADDRRARPASGRLPRRTLIHSAETAS